MILKFSEYFSEKIKGLIPSVRLENKAKKQLLRKNRPLI